VNVAVLGPSHVPFVWGGLDNLLWGLASHLRAATAHRVELLKTPTPEHDVRSIAASYRAWSRMELDSFDLVISVKYPTWMAQHPNHVIWMAHCLRGLHDMYPVGLPQSLPPLAEGLARARQQLLDAAEGGCSNQEAADLAVAVVDQAAQLEPELLGLPGPLARELVQALDAVALRPDRIRRYAAISATVAARPTYFPPEAEVAVVYPPVAAGGFHSGTPSDYLFTASRLDGPKRIGLLVSAFRRSRWKGRFLVAGTGPERERLEQIATGEPRVELLGHVSEQQLRDLYAGCKAVAFAPEREDFGYIALEAQLSGKALITTTDSGGPAELVKHGVSGLVVPPTVEALAQAFDQLDADPALAERLGAAGQATAEEVGWPAVARALVDGAPSASGSSRAARRARRPRLAVALPFPVTPPSGGGKTRVFELYRRLAAWADVDLVCLDPGGDTRVSHPAPGLREVVVAASPEHRRREAELCAAVGSIPVTDVALPGLLRHTPELAQAFGVAAAEADLLVASHPYTAPLLAQYQGLIPITYEAHNVELALKRAVLGTDPASQELLKLTEAVEGWCLKAARLTMACSDEDREALRALYGPPPGVIVLVPNGVDPAATPYVGPAERRARQGSRERPTCVFLGSWHPPNLEACEAIFALAPERPEVDFLVIGNVDLYYRSQQRAVPENVKLLGFLPVEEKQRVMQAADLALNPMKSGSGTNLKVLDYGASGIPVLSTPLGMRGLDPLRSACALAELPDFAERIRQLLSTPPEQRADVALARQVVERHYAWDVIAAGARAALQALL
jgi:glycosyltransferase involved in cell wall biosynthesis